jgi:phenylacetic acid degradation operon negative regulatory protein
MSISLKLLKAVSLGTEIFVQIDDLKYLPYKLMWGSSLQGYKRRSTQAALSNLVKRGLVKKIKNNEEIYLAITKIGEEWLEKKEHKKSFTLNPSGSAWDGFYRFVLFDIPEKDRAIRDTLRKALKDLGAVNWQKSVWVTKENITSQMGEFIDETGLEDYCTVLEVKQIYNPKLQKMLLDL